MTMHKGLGRVKIYDSARPASRNRGRLKLPIAFIASAAKRTIRNKHLNPKRTELD